MSEEKAKSLLTDKKRKRLGMRSPEILKFMAEEKAKVGTTARSSDEDKIILETEEIKQKMLDEIRRPMVDRSEAVLAAQAELRRKEAEYMETGRSEPDADSTAIIYRKHTEMANAAREVENILRRERAVAERTLEIEERNLEMRETYHKGQEKMLDRMNQFGAQVAKQGEAIDRIDAKVSRRGNRQRPDEVEDRYCLIRKNRHYGPAKFFRSHAIGLQPLPQWTDFPMMKDVPNWPKAFASPEWNPKLMGLWIRALRSEPKATD